jgi:hypothetical protein
MQISQSPKAGNPSNPINPMLSDCGRPLTLFYPFFPSPPLSLPLDLRAFLEAVLCDSHVQERLSFGQSQKVLAVALWVARHLPFPPRTTRKSPSPRSIITVPIGMLTSASSIPNPRTCILRSIIPTVTLSRGSLSFRQAHHLPATI